MILSDFMKLDRLQKALSQSYILIDKDVGKNSLLEHRKQLIQLMRPMTHAQQW